MYAQKSKPVQRDTIYVEKAAPISNRVDYEEQIKQFNKEITELSKTIADTKQTFYDSKLNFWNYILTAIALVFVIVAYIGLKSIAEKIKDLKDENEKGIQKSEGSIRDIKTDLLQRISDIKNDVRDFKTDQVRLFEKFEKEGNEKIKKGLDTELAKAIDTIMKGSFESVLNDITEQINDLTRRLDGLSKGKDTSVSLSGEEKAPILPMSIEPKTNAFDDEQP